MPHVVTEACIRCRYTDCVEVCPVDCFYAGPKMLVIGEECIDCGLCIDTCPVNAIYAEEDLPHDQKDFVKFNTIFSKQWPSILQKENPPKDVEQWKIRLSKREQITKELEQIKGE